MIKCRKLLFSKILAFGLSLILFYGDFSLYSLGAPVFSGELQNTFDTALAGYHNKSYEKAAAQLESILSSKEAAAPDFKAKIYLLLGACYEKSGQKEKAKHYFLELKKLLNGGLIEAVPGIPGVEPDSLSGYGEVFGRESFFKFKEPVAVSEVLKHKVVHAPRKSIEQKEKEKKKKKFPWLIAIGAVVIIGTAAVLLLAKDSHKTKQEEETGLPNIIWLQVPAGEFLMGDNFKEGERDELPVHKVYLDIFHISQYEVFQRQYDFFCEATGRTTPWDISQPTKPVIMVSWDDAKAFCDWLSQETGENIHLPTEAQWEKAARSTGQIRYPWGNDPPDNMKANFLRDISEDVARVGQRSYRGRSPAGANDMAGNAAEWCADWYSASYYSISPANNPTGPASGSFRVLRGGSYIDDAQGIRSANRDFHDPAKKSRLIGFRIVKEVD